MLRHGAALTILLLLAGCSSSTTLIDADRVAPFEPGKTNQTEVVASLGKPLHTIVEADGTKIDQYPYAGSASSGGGSILPDFLGGDSTPSTYGMVSFLYGSGGVLENIDRGGSR